MFMIIIVLKVFRKKYNCNNLIKEMFLLSKYRNVYFNCFLDLIHVT